MPIIIEDLNGAQELLDNVAGKPPKYEWVNEWNKLEAFVDKGGMRNVYGRSAPSVQDPSVYVYRFRHAEPLAK